MIAFDDNGDPCGEVDFVYPSDEPDLEDRSEAQQAIATILSGFSKLSPLKAGQQAHILAHKLGLSGCRTDAD